MLEPERDVVFRGEELVVRATARQYWGTPIADATIRFTHPDGRVTDLRTDKDGIADLRSSTRDFANEGTLTVWATLVQEVIEAQTTVQLALREYTIRLTTPRETVLAGEPLTVEVETRGAGGRPVGRELTLVVERSNVRSNGSTVRVELSRRTFETDPDTGLALVTQAAPAKGGWITVRVEGIDRFENVILRTAAVFVSDAEDEQRLRFLVPTDAKWSVGEEAHLVLYHRAGAGPCLLTWETDSILDARVVRLVEGENHVRFALTAAHLPLVAVSAARIEKARSHRATTAVQVRQEMHLTVELDRSTWQPGHATKVGLRVTDRLGRPVEAELSLAVVDAALFDQYPDPTPELAELFAPRRRGTVATEASSSCTFRYDGRTIQISEELLSEEARARAEAEWKAARVGVVGELERSARTGAPQRAGIGGPSTPGPGLFSDAPAGEEDFNDSIGGGGGAGGSFGARFGGRKNKSESDSGPPRLEDAETAFWRGDVTTDSEGRAVVEFELPRRSARWRIAAHGVDSGSLFGQHVVELSAASPISVELLHLAGLTEGDTPRFVARVHDASGMPGDLDLRLEFDGDGVLPASQSARLTLDGATRVDHVFEATAPLEPRGRLGLRITALRGETAVASDGLELSVRPFGVELVDSKSGVLRSGAVVLLELPTDAPLTDRRVELYVGPDVRSMLLQAATDDEALMKSRPYRPLGNADIAAELLGVFGVIELLESSGGEPQGRLAALLERARALTARLVTAQQGDSWPWSAHVDQGADEVTALVFRALVKAEARGIVGAGAARQRAAGGLVERSRDPLIGDETRAAILHAMATVNRAAFAQLNRLHRARHQLSAAALAPTALALTLEKRTPMAAEVASILQGKALPDRVPRGCRWPTEMNAVWYRDRIAMAALAVSALQVALPDSPRIAEGVEFLLAAQPWRTGIERGFALEAVARQQREVAPARDNFRVSARIAGETRLFELAPVRSDQGHIGGVWTVALPDAPAVPQGTEAEPVRVELVLEGRGEPWYRATLRGFRAGSMELGSPELTITSSVYHHAPLIEDGERVPMGWSVLRSSEGKQLSEVASLPAGERLVARVAWQCGELPEESGGDALLVRIPLPAGVRPLLDDLRRDEAYSGVEFRAGELTLETYLSSHGGSAIAVELLGTIPGSYRAVPASIESVWNPSRRALSDARAVEVLESDRPFPEERVLTPDETHFLGLAASRTGRDERAWRLLSPLLEQYEKELRPDVMRDVAIAVFSLATKRGDAAATVRSFESVRNHAPDWVVPFDDILAAASAYQKLGEHERAFLVYRAVIEETFAKDLKIVGILQSGGWLAQALATLRDLWLGYPDLPSVVQAELTATDAVLRAAPEAHRNESLRRAGLDRAELVQLGVLSLRRFIAAHPRDPLAADAALNLVSAYVDLEDHAEVARLGEEMADRFEKPEYADSFRYARAVANWRLDRTEEAVEGLEGIVAARYAAGAGVAPRKSPNHDLGLFILGQIFHAKQQVERATTYYEQVAGLYPDARASLDDFRREVLEVTELTRIRPGESLEIELRCKNLREVELFAYAVDLLTLYLREKDLSNVRAIELAGIDPTLRRSIVVGEGFDLKPVAKRVPLEGLESGAYLLIARSGSLHSSGLVLVSDLELVVEEFPTSGVVRVQAIDGESGEYAPEVDVRVVGSEDGEIHRGKTDLRGLYTSADVSGRATVIAKRGERTYAFHRGSVELGASQREKSKQLDAFRPGQQADKSYFDNVFDQNFRIQETRAKDLQQLIDRNSIGVEVRQVK